jgi:hypothetical protein
MGHLIFSTNNNSRFDFYFSGKYLLLRLISAEDFCSLLVAIGQKGTFYAIIIASILSHPPVFFPRIFNKLRIFSVPVFRVPE